MKKFFGKLKKAGVFLLSAALIVVSPAMSGLNNINAEVIAADGKSADISSDGEFIYINYSGNWENYVNLRFSVQSDVDLGAFAGIVVAFNNFDENATVGVVNDWYAPVEGGEAVVVNTDKKEEAWAGYERTSVMIKIPTSIYKNLGASNLTVSWEGGQVGVELTAPESTTEPTVGPSDPIKDPTAPTEPTTDPTAPTEPATDPAAPTEPATDPAAPTEPIADPTEPETEPTTEQETVPESGIVVSGGIQIDGMYDDWSGVPKTIITYMGDNSDCNHYGQLFTDGDTLYGHFKASDLYEQDMKIHIWNLMINGQSFAVQIQPEQNGNIDWSSSKPLSQGTHTGLKVFIGYGNNNECNSNVAYTIYDENHSRETRGDEIEFSLSLSRLFELTGITPEEMNVITIVNPNLGGEGVSIAGSSTGPWLWVIVAFGASISAFLSTRKRKEE